MGFFSKAKDTATAAWDCKGEIATVIGTEAMGSGGVVEKVTRASVNSAAVVHAYNKGRKSGKD